MGSPHFVELPQEAFVKEALSIVERAREASLTLRLLGSLAVYVHSLDIPACLSALRRLGRFSEGAPLFTDLDLAAYSRQRREIGRLLEGLGFRPAAMVNALFGNRRLIYYHPKGAYQVDVFMDKLEFSHDVTLGEQPGNGRLELDYPTISLADIVLEKLQIHQTNRKDLVDLAILFLGHDVRKGLERDAIDGAYVARVLADDWGFWYDAVNNLAKVRALVRECQGLGKLDEAAAKSIEDRLERLKALIDEEPKTKRWMKRAQAGTSKPWYRPVEELVR